MTISHLQTDAIAASVAQHLAGAGKLRAAAPCKEENYECRASSFTCESGKFDCGAGGSFDCVERFRG